MVLGRDADNGGDGGSVWKAFWGKVCLGLCLSVVRGNLV